MPEPIIPPHIDLAALMSAMRGELTAIDVSARRADIAPSEEHQSIISSIPIAGDGDVIYAEHHNSVRWAIARLLRYLDARAIEGPGTVTLSPALLPVDDDPVWQLGIGKASAQGEEAIGWMPVSLPSGSRIESMAVHGKRENQPGAAIKDDFAWSVALVRHEPGDKNHRTLVRGWIEATGDISQTFGTLADLKGDREELLLVDNERYRYLFVSKVQAASGTHIDLYGVQVVCSRSGQAGTSERG